MIVRPADLFACLRSAALSVYEAQIEVYLSEATGLKADVRQVRITLEPNEQLFGSRETSTAR
jgi:hypothetical protein